MSMSPKRVVSALHARRGGRAAVEVDEDRIVAGAREHEHRGRSGVRAIDVVRILPGRRRGRRPCPVAVAETLTSLLPIPPTGSARSTAPYVTTAELSLAIVVAARL
jgi:hypothetical protein